MTAQTVPSGNPSADAVVALRLSEQIELDHLSVDPRVLTVDQLEMRRTLAGRALVAGQTLSARIWLKGLIQTAQVELSRRHGDVRNGGRDSIPETPAQRERREAMRAAMRTGKYAPGQREHLAQAFRALASGIRHEAEGMSYGNGRGRPLRWTPPSRRRLDSFVSRVVRPVARARGRRHRFTLRRAPSASPGRRSADDPDPEPVTAATRAAA